MKIRIILDSISKLARPAAIVLALGMLPALAAPRIQASEGTYQSPDAFLAETFPNGVPPARALWLRPEQRQAVADVLGRSPAPRVRYWQDAGQTVWVLDEVGKDLPITAGVVVRDGAIDQMRVLVFRESRGWEVKYPFFTSQFSMARLTEDYRLNRHVDGITGATLSVRAMTTMARVALLLDTFTRQQATDLANAR